MTTPVVQGSIRRRLLVTLLVGAAGLAVLLYFTVQSVARQVAQDSQDNILSASALSILDSARFSAGEFTVDLPYSALSMLDSVTDEQVFYAIRLGAEFVSSYADLPEPEAAGNGRAVFLSAKFKGQDVRIATLRRAISSDVGQNFLQVSVAQTLTGQNAALARISGVSVGIGAGFFGLSALFAVFIARSTIRPLDRLTGSVSRRGPKDLRPVAAPVPAEMLPLVSSLNSFMARLQVSLARSEDFIAEAAHRVRTPLAIVRTRAEIAERKTTDDETRTALHEMIHAIDDSSRAAGQLLDHAMVAFRLDDMTKEPVNLSQMVQDCLDRLHPLSEFKDIDIRASGETGVTVPGDAILLQNALHNVLDNAIKYAPTAARVDVHIDRQEAMARIGVTDTGPGFPQANAFDLTKRFARGANVEGIVGSGLGLTIVRDVIEAHDGRITIENTAEGGACVTLFLPSS